MALQRFAFIMRRTDVAFSGRISTVTSSLKDEIAKFHADFLPASKVFMEEPEGYTVLLKIVA